MEKKLLFCGFVSLPQPLVMSTRTTTTYVTKNTFVHVDSSSPMQRSIRSYSLPVVFDLAECTPSTESSRRGRFPTADLTNMSIPESGEESSSSERQCNDRFFVGGLSAVTTDETLRDYFSDFGSVKDAAVIMDKRTRQSRGFGFVTFDHHVTVQTLERSTHVIDSKQAGVRNYGT